MEPILTHDPLALALMGKYFRVGTAIGTGVTMGIQTAYSATANVLFALYNGGTKNAILDRLVLINTVAGASTTSSHLAIRIDSKDRYTGGSGGTDYVSSIANVHGAYGAGSTITIFRGFAITANAEGTGVRTACRAALKIAAAPCWAVNDTVVMQFGRNTVQYGGLAATTASIMPHNLPPLIIPPGWSATFHMWNVANATTAPSWEFEMGWWER